VDSELSLRVFLLEPMFEIPGSDITAVHINEDIVMERHLPIYTRNLTMDDSSSTRPDSTTDEVMLELKRRA